MKHLLIFTAALLSASLATAGLAATTTPQIAGGISTSFVLKADGSLWAWGDPSWGELGTPALSRNDLPQQVTVLNDVVAIAAGNEHTLGLQRNGTVWSWGHNNKRQLGLGNKLDQNSPQQISGLSDVIAVAAGGWHSLALKRDGSVWSWGFNRLGQLGQGDTNNRGNPQKVEALSDIIAIAGGIFQSFALQRDGTVWSWGGNENGQLGLGNNLDQYTPHKITALSNIVALSSGSESEHVYALKQDGTVWTWGWNLGGELGLGNHDDQNSPCQIPALSNVIAIGGGYHHGLALQRDGSLWSWGSNSYGALGLGDFAERTSPQKITALGDVVAISSTGGWHSLAMKKDGSLWVWGDGYEGQLGLGGIISYDRFPSPQQLDKDTHIASDFTLNRIDLGSIARGAKTTRHENFQVTGSASPMTMNFDDANVIGNNSLASYASGSCASGSFSNSDSPCSFDVSSTANGHTGLAQGLLTIPASGTFARAVMVPVVAAVTGGQLYADVRSPSYFLKKPLNSINDKLITFSNKGDADIVITNVVLSTSPDFSLVGDNCSGQTLHASEHCSTTVRFKPTAGGVLRAKLNVHSNDPVSPVISLDFTGVGDAARLVLAGAPLHLGNVSVGSSKEGQLHLSNVGTQTLNISAINEQAKAFSIAATTCGTTLASNANCSVTLRFTPASIGMKKTTVSILSNDPNYPIKWAVVDGVGI